MNRRKTPFSVSSAQFLKFVNIIMPVQVRLKGLFQRFFHVDGRHRDEEVSQGNHFLNNLIVGKVGPIV